jgi:RNA polymerase sigma-70 factor (ECF subfamily)
VSRAGPLVDQLESRLPNPEKTLVEAEDLRQALRELNALPDRQREVLYLCAVEGLSLDEAADVLGIGKDAVKSSLCQARRKMRQRLSNLLDGRPVRES